MTFPNWANETMIAKGIGFERAEVKAVIWGYFCSQFSEFDCDQNQLETYFAHMVDKLIKDGDIDKARKHFDGNVLKQRPIRRSQLAQFEAKAQRLLDSYDD